MKVCKHGHNFDGRRCVDCSRKSARERWYRLGKCHPKKSSLERFEIAALPEPNSGCWIWTKALSNAGYGKLRHEFDKSDLAHRFAYWQFRGTIPDDLVLDHLCRNTWCVNPNHLEIVTERVNLIRGNSPVGVNYRKTHCINGHEFSESNTYLYSNKKRVCRRCAKIRAKKFNEKVQASHR